MSEEHNDDDLRYDEAASKEMLAAVWAVFDEVHADSDIDAIAILRAIRAANGVERAHSDKFVPEAFDVVASVLWARLVDWEMHSERLELSPNCKGAGPLLAFAQVAVALEAMSAAESALTDGALFGANMTRTAQRIAERKHVKDEAEA